MTNTDTRRKPFPQLEDNTAEDLERLFGDDAATDKNE